MIKSLQNNGKTISWSHIVELYEKGRASASGLTLTPKLKYEHVHLGSFSKMRVDLAAQVINVSWSYNKFNNSVC